VMRVQAFYKQLCEDPQRISFMNVGEWIYDLMLYEK
jgi:hypothetical protein